MQDDLNRLVEAARGGDTAALRRLLVIAQPAIKRYARRTCRRTSDIDDAMQETMSLIARHLQALREVASFTGWMMAIVRRACLRMARWALPTGVPVNELEDDLHPKVRRDSDLSLDLAGALASLPRHYRRILILRDIQEFTIEEIAEIEELSREAVKGRLNRARAMARRYLTREM